MRGITVFTSNQPRHLGLVIELSKVYEKVYAIIECNTVNANILKSNDIVASKVNIDSLKSNDIESDTINNNVLKSNDIAASKVNVDSFYINQLT